MSSKKLIKGFSTLEIIISLFIITAVISSLFSVFFGSQYFFSDSQTISELIYRGRFNLEEARALGYSNIQTLDSSEELVVNWLYDFSKEIKSQVGWDSPFLNSSFELKSFVSDWKQSVGASTCFRDLSPIENYQIKSSLPLSESANATDIDVVRGKAYITLNGPSNSENFFVVDVSNPALPEIISRVVTRGTGNEALHIAGRYAYIANDSVSAQLQIFDIANPVQPQPVKDFKIVSNDPEIPNPGQAVSIFYSGKKIYLGTKASANFGHEFHIIDVSTPSNPTRLGSWEADTTVNDIIVDNGSTFIALGSSTPSVVWLDTNTNLIDSFPTASIGRAVSLIENTLILGGHNINRNNNQIFLFDISGENLDLRAESSINATVRDLILRENTLVVAAVWGDYRTLQLRNIDLELIEEINLAGAPVALDCEDNFIYVVTEDPAGLLIFEIL